MSAPAYLSACVGGWNSTAPTAPPTAAGSTYVGGAPAANAGENGDTAPSNRIAPSAAPTPALRTHPTIFFGSALKTRGCFVFNVSKAKRLPFIIPDAKSTQRDCTTPGPKKPSGKGGRKRTARPETRQYAPVFRGSGIISPHGEKKRKKLRPNRPAYSFFYCKNKEYII